MQSHDLLNLVAEHFDADCKLFIHRNNLDRISANAEGASLESDVIALVLNIDKLAKESVTFDLIPHLDMEHAIDIFLRCA